MKLEIKTPVDCATGAEENILKKLNDKHYNDKFLKVKPVTKAEIALAFEDTLSSSAIQLTGDGYEVIGKWCRIYRHDNGDWDIWIIASNRKINEILKKLPQDWGFKIVDGEAWCWVKSAKEIVKHLSCLGIKKKKRISDATKEKLQERMAAVRASVGVAAQC